MRAVDPAPKRDLSVRGADQAQPIRVLIVGGDDNVQWMWKRHLLDEGFVVNVVFTEDDALERLRTRAYDIVVLDLSHQRDAAQVISAYANVRRPDARLVFIAGRDHIGDGALFQMCANACAIVPAHGYPSDLSAVIQHFAVRGRRA